MTSTTIDAAPGGAACEACRKPMRSHRSRVRRHEQLCERCNVVAGLLGDSAATARRLADYVEYWEQEHARRRATP